MTPGVKDGDQTAVLQAEDRLNELQVLLRGQRQPPDLWHGAGAWYRVPPAFRDDALFTRHGVGSRRSSRQGCREEGVGLLMDVGGSLSVIRASSAENYLIRRRNRRNSHLLLLAGDSGNSGSRRKESRRRINQKQEGGAEMLSDWCSLCASGRLIFPLARGRQRLLERG